jgi:hypothetical protein
VAFFLQDFPPKPCTCFSHLPCVPHALPTSFSSTWLPNNIWWWVQNMKLFIVQLSPFSRYFLPLRSKYFPQHPVLKHPQSMHRWLADFNFHKLIRRTGFNPCHWHSFQR